MGKKSRTAQVCLVTAFLAAGGVTAAHAEMSNTETNVSANVPVSAID